MSSANLWMLHLGPEDDATIPLKPPDVLSVKYQTDCVWFNSKTRTTYQAKIRDQETGTWLRSTSTSLFQSYVLFFKKCISRALIGLKKTQDDSKLSKEKFIIESCVTLLDMLHEINLQRKLPISYKLFYLNDLMEKINIEGDYALWTIESQEGKSVFRFCKYPFLYNTAAKFTLLRRQCGNLIQAFAIANLLAPAPLTLRIKRNDPLTDAQVLLSWDEMLLHGNLDVIFEGEIEYSGDGIRQEFFQLVLKKLVDPASKNFSIDEVSQYPWFTKGSNPEMLKLTGLICGLALYHGATTDQGFPLALYKKLLKKPVTFEDLKELKPDYWSHLERMIHCDEDEEFKKTCSDLHFEVDISLQTGGTETMELCEDGGNVQVTQSNKLDYVDKIIDCHLNTAVDKEFKSFSEGFYKAIPEALTLLRHFHPEELKDMLEGDDDTAYDFSAFEKTTQYIGEYHEHHRTIKLFWRVFHRMECEIKKNFLKFVTASSRIAANGIESIKMTIQPRTEQPEIDPNYLAIRAHTCYNYIFLPKYTSEENMEDKISIAACNPYCFG